MKLTVVEYQVLHTDQTHKLTQKMGDISVWLGLAGHVAKNNYS